MINTRILNYKVDALLGEGGVGNVWLASHTQLGRKVAIKALHAELVNRPEVRERFRQEAATLSALQHLNIVTLYDYLEDERGLFLILEYVPGTSLDKYLHEVSGAIPEDRALPIFKQILAGVGYAHSRGVIHRDLKPSNLMLSNTGEVKILDFGIAKILKDTPTHQTQAGARLGTALYMSPEQVRGGNIDVRTDIYALGVTLFEILTGRCPYQADTMSEFAIYDQIINAPLPRARDFYPAVSEKMQLIIDKATAKNPADRFQSCEEFAQALEYGLSSIPQNAAHTPSVGLSNTTPPPPIGFSPNTPTATPPTQTPTTPTSLPRRPRKANYTPLYILFTVLLLGVFYLIYQELNKGATDGDAANKPNVSDLLSDKPNLNSDEPNERDVDKKEKEKSPEEQQIDSLEQQEGRLKDLIDVLQKDRQDELRKGLAVDVQEESSDLDLVLLVSVFNKREDCKFKDITIAINFSNEAGKVMKTIEQELEPLREGQSIKFRVTEPNKYPKFSGKVKAATPYGYEAPPTLDSLNKELDKVRESLKEIKEFSPGRKTRDN